MKNFFAFLIFFLFTLSALYVGIWVMFVGGIVQGINALSISPVDGFGVAIGILKIIFASLVGYLLFAVGLIFAGTVSDIPYKIECRFGRSHKRK